MTSKGTLSKTENVYLQKNGDEFIYIPKVGGNGGAKLDAPTSGYAETVGGQGPKNGGTGGGSGAVNGSRGSASAGIAGGSYGGGIGGGTAPNGLPGSSLQKNLGGSIAISADKIIKLRKYKIKWKFWMDYS